MEEGGERWSKPHVATLNLRALLELRSCLRFGALHLHAECSSREQLAGTHLNLHIHLHSYIILSTALHPDPLPLART